MIFEKDISQEVNSLTDLAIADRLAPDSAGETSLVDVLCHRSAVVPARVAYRFLEDGGGGGEGGADAGAHRRAGAVGAFLQKSGAAGERVLLLYPPGIEFVTAFMGCLYGGAVAVPAYPPRINRPDGRLQAITEDARPRFALTTSALRERGGGGGATRPGAARRRGRAPGGRR